MENGSRMLQRIIILMILLRNSFTHLYIRTFDRTIKIRLKRKILKWLTLSGKIFRLVRQLVLIWVDRCHFLAGTRQTKNYLIFLTFTIRHKWRHLVFSVFFCVKTQTKKNIIINYLFVVYLRPELLNNLHRFFVVVNS